MRAGVLRQVGEPILVESLDIDQPGPQEILIRTVASGVCHSDLHFVEGLQQTPLPTVLGHEVAGVVEAVGSEVAEFAVGDHVVTCVSSFCGRCRYCLSGRPHLCVDKPRRTSDDPPALSLRGAPVHQFFGISGFAEQVLVHEHAVVKVTSSMPLDRAALIGCAVLTGVGAVLHTARVEPGSSVIIIGCGGVGLAAIQGAVLAGARQVVAVDVAEAKLKLAEKLGATHTVRGGRENTLQELIEVTGGGATYSFEAVGNRDLVALAFTALSPGGTATIIGLLPAGHTVELPGSAFMAERKVQGCSMGSNRFRTDVPLYVDLYQQGRLNLDDMVTHRADLAEVNEAMRAMKSGEVARTVLTFD